MWHRKRKLKYTGSVVLGLNDALVELTGALAGFSFALQNTRLIAVLGVITGVAAALSMASSEYLSIRSDSHDGHHPVRAAIYTGIAYMTVVILLIIPFFVFSHYLVSLLMTLIIGLAIIVAFTFYISRANKLSFWKRFLEMAGISFGVALISFIIGYLVRIYAYNII